MDNEVIPAQPVFHLLQGRRWCFTLFHTQEDELPLEFSEFVRYAVYQEEICPQTLRPHIQGYLECSSSIRGPRLRKYAFYGSERASFRIANGTREQNIEYCTKEESRKPDTAPHFYGRNPQPGRRTDIDDLKRRLDEGQDLRTISEDCFSLYLKYNTGIGKYLQLHQENRSWKTCVTVFIGPPGCGKSRRVQSEAPDAYWKLRGIWFDGYDPERHRDVVLDDFYGWIPYDLLLRIMDRYPCFVETKGSACSFKARNLYITSNATYENWYNTENNPNMNLLAIRRRIDHLFIWNEVFNNFVEIFDSRINNSE